MNLVTWEESNQTETPKDYCDLVTLHLARIVNLLADDRQNTLNELWDDLQLWFDRRPSQTLPVLKTESSRGNPFPIILHAGNSSVCADTFYHTGCITLLSTGRVQSRANDNHDLYSPVWHATELCGISVTNSSHACWVNQVYPLYIAGLVYCEIPTDFDGAEYAAEKFALLKHLSKIE